MASDAVGAEEVREKFRWSENSKVYSRKIHRANKNTNTNNNGNATTATTSNQNATTAADAAVAGIPAENDKESDVSQTNEAARDNSGPAETPAADGGDFIAPPDSQASPAKDVDSQPQQPVSPNLQSSPAKDSNSQLPQPVSPNNSRSSPAKDASSELLQPVSLVSQSSPAKDAISEPPQLVSQSSPAKDASSEPPQPVLPVLQSSPAMDANSEPPQMVSQSSPAKDADSELPQAVSPVSPSSPAKDANSELPQPVSPVLQSSQAMDANSEPPQMVSQSSPAKDANSELPQPVSQSSPARDANSELPQPVSPVPQSSPARDANSEPPLPVSQSSPAKDVNSQPPQQVSPNSHSSPAKDATSQPESHSSPAKDTNSQSQQPDLLRTDAVELVCDDSSSLNRQEGDLPNGNGVAPVRPVVTRVGDRVSISLSSATPKHEARELKRKLLSDLDQVRSLAKRLDTKEAQVFSGGLTTSADAGAGAIIPYVPGQSLTSADAGAGAIIPYVPGQSLSQYSTSEGLGKGGGLRAHSEGVSTGLNDSRAFRRLSVSVMDINRSGSGANETAFEKEKRTPKANQFYQNSDFICGKDKFPPAESNKKQKSSGRKKHGVGGSEFDKHIFKKCGSLLQQLMKHKFSWVFNTPVDVKGLELHDYYDIIKHPMDLGTVKSRLSKNWYKSPSEFAEDVRLTFNNAMTYNPKGQDVHVMAAELSNTFEQKWVEIEAEYNSKLRYEAAYDMGLPTPTSRLAPLPFYVPPQPTTPAPRLVYPEMRHLDRSESFALPVGSRMKPVYSAPVGRAPAPKKPKAKDPNKRNMTFDEKQKLSTNLQALPSDKLDNIVQIITKSNPSLCQHDEEVEVDIDSVDAETLWELDRFVTNYKKTLSKHKRKAELALQKSQAQLQIMQADNPDAQRPEVPKETTPDNPNPAAGSTPVRDGKQANNASGSSSSSSSSSDSGSSSSDSDSDSSSGSGSEGGQ